MTKKKAIVPKAKKANANSAIKKATKKVATKSTKKKSSSCKSSDKSKMSKSTAKKATKPKAADARAIGVNILRDANSGKIIYSKTASNSLSSLDRADSRAVKSAVETLKESNINKAIAYEISSGKLRGVIVVKSGKYRAIVEKSPKGEIRVKDIINRDAQAFYTK